PIPATFLYQQLIILFVFVLFVAMPVLVQYAPYTLFLRVQYSAVRAIFRHEWPETLLEQQDRKSTRLNSNHVSITYVVFCLKKKNINTTALSKDIVNETHAHSFSPIVNNTIEMCLKAKG